ncbi:DUF4262 domain-containing protein [Cellulomonas massiliensis]|uniref:DUF4262 domain-containing protein n=1 Tax=Cellulomonas massiliensis TaxID=1465811 RepID=UPI0013754DC7|nr:DUF4262 domain-containing protein [Cellulomonas massiliensis]
MCEGTPSCAGGQAAWEAQGRRDGHERRLVELVARYGWAVQHVLPGADEPAFSYTVGLSRVGLPELVLFGHGPDCAHDLLNAVAGRLWDGAPYRDDALVDDVLVRGSLMLVRAVDTTRHLVWAHELAAGRWPVDAWQLVLPDAEGRWPWEEGSEVAHLPLLGVPAASADP